MTIKTEYVAPCAMITEYKYLMHKWSLYIPSRYGCLCCYSKVQFLYNIPHFNKELNITQYFYHGIFSIEFSKEFHENDHEMFIFLEFLYKL